MKPLETRTPKPKNMMREEEGKRRVQLTESAKGQLTESASWWVGNDNISWC